jgi:hypothetical protein
VIKNLVTLLILGLTYSNASKAQEFAVQDDAITSQSQPEMGQNELINSSFYPPSTLIGGAPTEAAWERHTQHNPPSHARSFGRPVVVLPAPPVGNSITGLHYPGSYIPQGTPLHRFNGYTVCDPPKLVKEPTAEKVTGATPQRLVKITSTRSPAVPSDLQPCPIYTLNGELPRQKSATTSVPPTQNAPSRQGER